MFFFPDIQVWQSPSPLPRCVPNIPIYAPLVGIHIFCLYRPARARSGRSEPLPFSIQHSRSPSPSFITFPSPSRFARPGSHPASFTSARRLPSPPIFTDRNPSSISIPTAALDVEPSPPCLPRSRPTRQNHGSRRSRSRSAG